MSMAFNYMASYGQQPPQSEGNKLNSNSTQDLTFSINLNS